MCDQQAKIVPKVSFGTRAIIVIGAFALAVSSTSGKEDWWSGNAGFEGRSWIFSLKVMIISMLLISILYLWLWDKVARIKRSSNINSIFALTVLLFLASFIALFLYQDPKASYWIGIFALLFSCYQTWYCWSNISPTAGVAALVVNLSIFHFLAQVYVVKV
jgi:hypothetical protein